MSTMARLFAVCVTLLSTGLALAAGVTVTITNPADHTNPNRYVKSAPQYPDGTNIKTFVATLTGGDADYWVKWTFGDTDTSAQGAAVPGTITHPHEFTTAGTGMVTVAVYDNAGCTGTPLASDSVTVWVLWITSKDVRNEESATISFGNSAGTEFYARTGHYMLGPGLVLIDRVGWSAEFVMECTPNVWDKTVTQKRWLRNVNGYGCKEWDGSTLRSYETADKDDSSPSWAMDTDPQSYGWVDPPMGKSNGVVYDLDGPGVSLEGAQDGHTYRIRANFKVKAYWDGHLCSDPWYWKSAQSLRRQSGVWTQVNDYGGDNVEEEVGEQGLISLEYNLQ